MAEPTDFLSKEYKRIAETLNRLNSEKVAGFTPLSDDELGNLITQASIEPNSILMLSVKYDVEESILEAIVKEYGPIIADNKLSAEEHGKALAAAKNDAKANPDFRPSPVVVKYDEAYAKRLVNEMSVNMLASLTYGGIKVDLITIQKQVAGNLLEYDKRWERFAEKPEYKDPVSAAVMGAVFDRNQVILEFPEAPTRYAQLGQVLSGMQSRGLITEQQKNTALGQNPRATATDKAVAAQLLNELYPKLDAMLGSAINKKPSVSASLKSAIQTDLGSYTDTQLDRGESPYPVWGGDFAERRAETQRRKIAESFALDAKGKEPNILAAVKNLLPSTLINSTDADTNKAAGKIAQDIANELTDWRRGQIASDPSLAGSPQLMEAMQDKASTIQSISQVGIFEQAVEQEITVQASAKRREEETSLAGSEAIAKKLLWELGRKPADVLPEDLSTIQRWIANMGEPHARVQLQRGLSGMLERKRLGQYATETGAANVVKEAMFQSGIPEKALTPERVRSLSQLVSAGGPEALSGITTSEWQGYINEAVGQKFTTGTVESQEQFLRDLGMDIPIGTDFQAHFRANVLPQLVEAYRQISRTTPGVSAAAAVSTALGIPKTPSTGALPPREPWEDEYEHEQRIKTQYPEEYATRQRAEQLAVATPRTRLQMRLEDYSRLQLKPIGGISPIVTPEQYDIQTGSFLPMLPAGIAGPLAEYGIPPPGGLGWNPYFPESYTQPAHYARLGVPIEELEAERAIERGFYQDEPFMEYLKKIQPEVISAYGTLRPIPETVTGEGVRTAAQDVPVFSEFLKEYEPYYRLQYYQTPSGYKQYASLVEQEQKTLAQEAESQQKLLTQQQEEAARAEETALREAQVREQEETGRFLKRLRRPRTLIQPLGVR